MIGLLLVLLAGAVAYELGWKGSTLAQMRADLARLLQLPSAGRLAAAAQLQPIGNVIATGASAATSGGAAALQGGGLIGSIVSGLFGDGQPAPAASSNGGPALVQP